MSVEQLKEAIAAIKAGDHATGGRLLSAIVKEDPNNELAWLWLSACVRSTEQKELCLSKVLAINPDNETARRGLDKLRAHRQTTGVSVQPKKSHPIELSVSSDEKEVTYSKHKPTKPAGPKDNSNRKTALVVASIAISSLLLVCVVIVGILFLVQQSGLLQSQFVGQIDQTLSTIPTQIADVPLVTLPPTWTPEPPSTQDLPTLTPSDFPETTDPRFYVLTIKDMPAGFQMSVEDTGYTDNQQIAANHSSQPDILSKLNSWGRINGYAAQYRKNQTEPIGINISVAIMKTTEGARSYCEYIYHREIQNSWSLVSVPELADDVKAFTRVDVVKEDDGSTTQWTTYQISVRKQNVIWTIQYWGLLGGIEFNDAFNYAELAVKKAMDKPSETSFALLPNITPKPLPTTKSSATPAPSVTPTSKPVTQQMGLSKKLGPILDTTRDESYSVKMTLNNASFLQGEGYSKPKAGYIYVVVDLTIENLGPSPMRSIGRYSFQIKDANGALRDPSYISAIKDCSMDSVDLSPKGNITGCVSFEVPQSGSLELIYAPYKYEGLKPGRYISFPLR